MSEAGRGREAALNERKPAGTVLSLFTGVGGLDIGLEHAGFTTLACLEIDDDARDVIQANRPSWRLLDNGDVIAAAAALRPRDLGISPGGVDLIVGGPPCQPFSKAAQWAPSARNGMRDPRAACVHGMLDLVDSFLPRALLIENVPGFLQGPDSALNIIGNRLDEINSTHRVQYQLTWQVIDAASYGVPQRRKRAIAIAYRDGQDVVLPKPTHIDAPIRSWDVLHDVAEAKKPSCTGYWADLLPAIPEGCNYLHLTARGGGEELFGWRTRYWSFLLKLAKDQPSWTLPASPGPSTGPFHWENRPLSVREQMRLQTFPDQWLVGKSTQAGRRLVGNATPPLLAEVLGRSILSSLELDFLLAGPPKLLRPRHDDVPAPESVAAVPTKYHQHRGRKAAHPGSGRGPSPRMARNAQQRSHP